MTTADLAGVALIIGAIAAVWAFLMRAQSKARRAPKPIVHVQPRRSNARTKWEPDPRRVSKFCSQCWLMKPVKEFARNGQYRDGLQPRCRQCQRERKLAKLSPRDRAAARARYSETDRARELRGQLSPEEQAEARKARNRANQRRFRERHPGYGTEITQRWRGSHPAEYAAYKATQRGAARVELVQPLEIFERDDWVCHICGGRVEIADASLDHVTPIALGGEHTAANLACSHRQCNYVKGDREGRPCESCGELIMPGPARCRWCGFPQRGPG